jgi:hypothetical protein
MVSCENTNLWPNNENNKITVKNPFFIGDKTICMVEKSKACLDNGWSVFDAISQLTVKIQL